MYKINKKIMIIIVVVSIILGIGYYIYIQNNSYETFLPEENLITNDEDKTTKEKSKIIIHVAGAVKAPGIIEIEDGSRIADAIEKAGGLKEDADISNINLASIIEDGIKIYIPSHTEIEEEKNMENNMKDDVITTNNNTKVNINTASQAELQTLPGIGESTAQKILNYRKENGKFNNIEDIKNVKGIGQNKYENIKDLITAK